MIKHTTDGQRKMLAALLAAYHIADITSGTRTGVDIAAAQLAAFGVMPRELLDEYMAVTGK